MRGNVLRIVNRPLFAFWGYLMAQRQLRKLWRTEAQGFDLKWIRRILSFSVGLIVLNYFIDSPEFLWPAVAANMTIGFFLSIYFGHLLFRRLQCSLLEWCLLIALLGNLMGWLVTTQGISDNMPAMLSLASILFASVLYGAVIGRTQAQILNVEGSLARVLVLGAAWLGLVAPALLAIGVILVSFRAYHSIISPGMYAWSWPLILVGVVGLGVRMYLSIRTVRAAKRVFLADNM